MGRRAAGRASTPATRALRAAGIDFTVHPYEHVPGAASYGTEAAEALDLDPREVFKTLVILADEEHAVAVTPVTGELDLKAVATVLGAKRAAMADPAQAERLTGMVVGGISPIGQRTRLRTVLDVSARDLARIYVSAGRRGVDLAVMPSHLCRITGAMLAAISRS